MPVPLQPFGNATMGSAATFQVTEREGYSTLLVLGLGLNSHKGACTGCPPSWHAGLSRIPPEMLHALPNAVFR